jgi:hypothetical protein
MEQTFKYFVSYMRESGTNRDGFTWIPDNDILELDFTIKDKSSMYHVEHILSNKNMNVAICVLNFELLNQE